MMKTIKNRRQKMYAARFLAPVFLALTALNAYAGGASALDMDLPLVNTQVINLNGVDNLSIGYGSDYVILWESESDELVLKEYMPRDESRYYADISQSPGTVSVKRGRRPWPYWSWKARAEIFLPRSFHGNLRLSNSSGYLVGKTDILDCQSIDISISSGSASLMRLSAETLSVRVASGELEILGASGNSLISVSSGRLEIGELQGGEHRIKVSSGRTRIGAIQGSNTIELSSGDLDITRIEGDSSLEVKSGSIRIADLSGTSHRIKTSSGNATIERARGGMDVRGTSGAITVRNFSGSGSFEMISGNLRLEMPELTGDLRFNLTSGNIDLDLPREIPFNLDALTRSGGIRIYENGAELLRVSGNSTVLRPIGSSPERTIYVRSSSGAVKINRRGN
jgi:lia operon protein LiaG